MRPRKTVPNGGCFSKCFWLFWIGLNTNHLASTNLPQLAERPDDSPKFISWSDDTNAPDIYLYPELLYLLVRILGIASNRQLVKLMIE